MSARLKYPIKGRSVIEAAATMLEAGLPDDVVGSTLQQARRCLAASPPDESHGQEVLSVATRMLDADLPQDFVLAATALALRSAPVRELMKMWTEEGEGPEIIVDLQELIDDNEQLTREDRVSVRFNDLDAIAKDIRGFKDQLRLIVEEMGGITKLAELTRIPQPSLSRFFSSVSMPRRTTLLKIAKALNLSDVQIATKWSR